MQASIIYSKDDPSGIDLQRISQVVLWDSANWVRFSVRRSKQPRLSISGDESMVKRYRCSRRGDTLRIRLGGNLLDRIVDALTTSLTRKHIQVELLIGSLDLVKATGLVQVDMADWNGVEPEIRLYSPTALWNGRFPMIKP